MADESFDSALRRRLSLLQSIGDDATETTLSKLRALRRQATSANLGNVPINGGTDDSELERLYSSIAQQESGGNYGARNRSSGAMGKYQIMPSNLGGSRSGWDYEALGYDVSPQQFMSDPNIQEQIARYKLKQYYTQFGAGGAAVAWYSGPGNVAKKMNSTRAQGSYPSINAYMNAIKKRMG